MKRTNDDFMFLLLGLASIVTIVAVLQRPLNSVLMLSACGFALFTFAWVGVYFRLKRELPGHALVDATYLNLSTDFGGKRRAVFRNMIALIQLHFKRHRIARRLFALKGRSNCRRDRGQLAPIDDDPAAV